MNKSPLFSRKELFLILSLAAVQFVNIIDFMIIMPLGPQLMRVFNIDPHQFGLLVSAYTFSASISGIASAAFIDGFDRKKALLFFFVGFCLGTFSCGIAPDYYSLLIARFLTGAFGGVLSSLVLAIVGDAIDTQRRGSAMGLVMMAFSAASIFGVPFSIFLATQFSWHTPFFFLGGLTIVLAGCLVLFLPNLTGHLAHFKKQSPFSVVLETFKNPDQFIALTFMFSLIFGQFALIPFLSPSFVSNAGLPESSLPLIYLTGGLISIVSSPMIGRLADKIGKHTVFSIFALLSIAPFYFVTNLSVVPVWVLLTLVAFFFAVMGGRMVPALAMVTGVVPPEKRGRFMALISSTQHFSSAIASYLAGIIVAKSETGQLLNYDKVGYIAIGFTILALLISRKLRFK